MSRFPPAAEALLWYETSGRSDGALTRDPDDPGGTTKWGISQRFHPELDVKSLTKEEALTVYETLYWSFYGLGRIRPQRIATLMLLAVTNMRAQDAIRALQRACRFADLAGVKRPEEDGRLGPVTLTAVHTLEAVRLTHALEAELLREYVERIDEPHEAPKRKYIGGWANRVRLLGLPEGIRGPAAETNGHLAAALEIPPDELKPGGVVPVDDTSKVLTIEPEPGEPGSEEDDDA